MIDVFDKLFCPQCKIAGLYVKNEKKERLLVYVSDEAEDLINIGAYKSGSNRNIDYAISKIDAVNRFLMQQTDEKFSLDEELNALYDLFSDYEDFENGSLKLGEQPKAPQRAQARR